MELTILERLEGSNVIPQEGDMLYLRMRQDLIGKLGLSGEELERYGFVRNEETGMATWNPDIPQEVEIDLTDAEVGVITEALQKRNKERTLTPNHMTLYEKFVGK